MVDNQSESFSKQLWEKHKKQAIFSKYSPFIISLAAGNLPVRTFEAYLYQDIHYLTAYAQAAYIAEEYATDAESKEKLQKLGDYSILYIQTCASFFEKSVKSMEYFIDKLSVGLPQEELDKIEEYYKKGLEHETNFFLAQEIVGQEVVVPLWKQFQGLKWSLVLDFHLWFTKSSCDLETLQLHEKLISNELLKTIPPGEYNFTAVREAFKLVSELEKTSFAEDDRFGQFEVDSGCIDLLLKVLEKDNLNGSAHAISACHNDDGIKSALIEEGLIGKLSHAGNKGSVESSIDKLEAFIENHGKKLSLYIGDSVGDLLCLLKSNIPIVDVSNEQLIKVGKHFLVSFTPLFKGLIDKQREYNDQASLSPLNPNPCIIYTFTYWAEILAFILVGT